jgi:glutathione S-transferase
MTKMEQKEPLKLFTVQSGWGVPFASAAPFPLKVETWLRMTGLRYEIVIENNPGKGPKKKTPWIVDGDVRMGDSELIIAYLKEKYGVDPDAGSSPEDRALATAWSRTFEEHYHQAYEHQLYFGRGGDERLTEMLSWMPAPMRPLIRIVFMSKLTKQLHARGLTRHGADAVIAMGKADLDAASAFLGDGRFFLGDEPRTIDACVFGFLGVSIYVAGDNPLFRHAASLDNLRAYSERMRARFFPETLSGSSRTARTASARASTQAASAGHDGSERSGASSGHRESQARS